MWDYLAPVTAIVLATMGIIPAFMAFAGIQRWLWIVGIFAVVLMNVLAAIFSVRSMHMAQEELLGATDFLVVYAEITDAKDTKASFPIVITNEFALPAYDVSVQIIDYKALSNNGGTLSRQINVGTVLPLFVPYKIDNSAVRVGTYRIIIGTRRTIFVERLRVFEEDGNVRQSYYIAQQGASENINRWRTCEPYFR